MVLILPRIQKIEVHIASCSDGQGFKEVRDQLRGQITNPLSLGLWWDGLCTKETGYGRS